MMMIFAAKTWIILMMPPQSPDFYIIHHHAKQKFTKWADKGTHINPFLPPRSSGALPVAAILCLIRLPFLLLALALLISCTISTNPFTSIIFGAGRSLSVALMNIATCMIVDISFSHHTGLLGYSIRLKPGLEPIAGTILGIGLAMVSGAIVPLSVFSSPCSNNVQQKMSYSSSSSLFIACRLYYSSVLQCAFCYLSLVSLLSSNTLMLVN